MQRELQAHSIYSAYAIERQRNCCQGRDEYNDTSLESASYESKISTIDNATVTQSTIICKNPSLVNQMLMLWRATLLMLGDFFFHGCSI